LFLQLFSQTDVKLRSYLFYNDYERSCYNSSLRKISRSVSEGESQNLMFYLCLWPWWW